MNRGVAFVNRTKEINHIQSMLLGNGLRALLFYSSGGLGKTRLMQELPSFLSEQNIPAIFPGIVDFDDSTFRVVNNVVHALLEQLSVVPERNKDEIYQALESLYRMDRVGDSQQTKDEQRIRIIKLLAETINRTSQNNKPIILRFDTVEKMEPIIQDAMALFISYLRTAYVLFAGRWEQGTISLWQKLDRFSANVVNRMELEPFNQEASEQYLESKEAERYIKLSPFDVAQLLTLAKGKPILIDLAVEYFARSPETKIVPEENNQISLKDSGLLYEPSLITRRTVEDEFEYRLVKFVTTAHSEIEQLILVLSRVYPLSEQMVATMLNLDHRKAAKLFEQAQTYVFIKVLHQNDGQLKITLHDEMRRMVLTHVWPQLDPEHRRRKRESRRAWEMFAADDDGLRDQIRELKTRLDHPHSRQLYIELLTLERKREIATEARIEHALYANFSEGFGEWQLLINKIRIARKYTFIGELCQLANPYFANTSEKEDSFPPTEPTEAQIFEYQFIKARSKQDLGEFEEAEKSYQQLLTEANASGNVPRRRQIANMLGVLKRDQGQIEAALEYQNMCRSLLSDDDFHSIANVENQLGWLYRLLKDRDFKYLAPAKQHFENAMSAARNAKSQVSNLEQKNQIFLLIAAIYNNLGYIHGLQKQYDRAELMCKQAIDIWERIGREREIAWAKINLGVMARDQRQYQHAEQRLKEAISNLIQEDDFRDLCQAYLQLGWTQWFMAEINKDKAGRIAQLEQARQNLEKSLQFAEEHNYSQEYPDVYHQLASVIWSQSRQKDNNDPLKRSLQHQARQINKKAIKWSEELKNNRYYVDAWVGEMEFDFDAEDNTHIHEHLAKLEPFQEYGFPLYFGRVERILGDWAFRDKNYEKAFAHYKKGIPLINSHGGYGPYKIEIELENLSKKIRQLSVEEAKTYLVDLSKVWKAKEGRVDLVFWVEEQLNQILILN